jgi:hypothetical protein
MSLNVPAKVLHRAEQGETIDDATFIGIIKESLPDAWGIFERLAMSLGSKTEEEMAIEAPQHMEPEVRGQLLRAMASTSMKAAIERHFGFVLAFQNCHAAGATKPGGTGSSVWKKFTSIEAQLRRQSPLMRDC